MTRKRGNEMTAVVSRERAAKTGLTAAAGVLMLAVAFVMMVVAAPGHGPVRAHQARPLTVRLETDVCQRLLEGSGKNGASGKTWCTIDPRILPKAGILPGKHGSIVLSSDFRAPAARG